MQKTLAAFVLAGLLLVSASTALATDGQNRTGDNLGGRTGLMAKLKLDLGNPENKDEDHRVDGMHGLAKNGFVIAGTVKSVSTNSMVLTVTHSHKNKDLKEGTDVTVKTDVNTKIMMLGKAVALTEVKVGMTVWTAGRTDNSVNTAIWIHVKAEKMRAMGEVTAKTNTSITVKNNVSGQVTTVPVNDDTKVTINGEAKTMADVQVGDKGIVKFKKVLDSVVASVVKLFR
jgi:hypothetical protein